MAITVARRPLLSKATQHTRTSISFVRRTGAAPFKPNMPAAAPREISTAQEANELIQKQGYKYLDVRRPDEFANGHAPGAVNINVQGDNFVGKVQQAFPDKEAKILVACQSGMRSTMAASQLADKYPSLVNFKGSFGAWAAANMPVEK